jgi:beta-1,4-mannosyl-glycoprotein beta-1,4-N-acetylglucosaminyltransferase
MKIIDCFMFFNEDLILDIRLNELDKYVDYFVIVESNFTHSGEEKGFNFNPNKFQKFKEKIIYLKILDNPKNLYKLNKSDTENEVKRKQILNALIIENYQRNYLKKGIENFSNNDFILISDLDEIPDLRKIELKNIKNSIVLFKQYFFHYKLNLYLKDFFFFGTKGCLKKNLISPQWLRNVKNKKYSLFRIDALFSKKKYSNIKIVEKGGWHFTNIMDEEKIIYKLKSYLHHADFPEKLLRKDIFLNLIKEKKIMYDHNADKKGDRFNSKPLNEFDKNLLPIYLQNNLEKFKDWIV